ncbi:DUF4242 domain-containing protein [Dethiobacter alkaliphilus]|uniref:DUF4242 domain-containing protein n=1 Tax=Dethiobacter alkaliphilus AHT 1 TaxID=555088 RepID=C0GK38_DETAL|nr:DUF4242 domain-containing protein [Dethiobacter alkaliphilus]EEG76308.1 conserved hypothetical protein [Dethiobacter alkaliphilus AHT 1]
MPLFLIKRNFGKITDEQLGSKASTSKKVCSAMPGVTWVRSYLSLENDEKVTYCIYEAPDADTVAKQAKDAGLPADEVIPLEAEIDPDTVQ